MGRNILPAEEKIEYQTYTFYIPSALKIVMKELDKLARERIKIHKSFKNRCKSMLIRREIFNYVEKYTDDPVVKDMIQKFKAKEDKYFPPLSVQVKEMKSEPDKITPEKKVIKKPVKKAVEEIIQECYCSQCPYNDKKEECLAHQGDCKEANRIINPLWLKKENGRNIN